MLATITRTLDRFIGRGAAAITVPPMDGALRPNQALEEAAALLAIPAPDNLTGSDAAVLFSSGATLFRLEQAGGGATAKPVTSCAAEIASLAFEPGSGATAIGLDQGGVLVQGGPHDGTRLTALAGMPLVCPTALAFDGPDTLLLCQGSAHNRPQDWNRDLMEVKATGSVWRIDLASGNAQCLVDRMAYPNGILLRDNGRRLLVAESWRHRLVELSATAPSPVKEVLIDLPGYPSRLAPAPDGGVWLCVFAPRSQLIEFVLREKAFRTRMMAEVDPLYWVAPMLSSNRTFLEPLQGGGIKQMGILKPWAPTRSYGLVIRLDAGMAPTASYHSRADGKRHGITSALQVGNTLLATSKGGDVLVALALAKMNGGLQA